MQHTLSILTRSFFSLIFLLLCSAVVRAQSAPDTSNIPLPVLGPNDTIPVPAMIHENEWIPGNNLEWFYVTARYPKHLLKKRQEWTRLRNAIYVTYPYAKKACAIMNEINTSLATIKNE